jgi:hypothetical protein
MHAANDIKRHLEHRTSILREFISERRNVSRDGFNCYMDSALITCRSLWALLGVETFSHKETDLQNPTGTKLCFNGFNKIRQHIDPSVTISPFTAETQLDALPEKQQIIKVLAASNKCVAHFDNLLDHGVREEDLEAVAKRLLDEISARIQIPA